MGEEQIFNLVGSLGFPIVVAGYLMVKMNKTLEGMTLVLNKLVDRIDGLTVREDDN